MVRVSLTAPLVPLLLEGQLECSVAVDEEAVIAAVVAQQVRC